MNPQRIVSAEKHKIHQIDQSVVGVHFDGFIYRKQAPS